MQQLTKTINRIPVNTWHRLHVNEAELMLSAPGGMPKMDGAGMRVTRQVTPLQDFGGLVFNGDTTDFFTPAEMQAFIEEHANGRYLVQIPKNREETEPILLEVHLSDQNPSLVDDVVIIAEESSNAVVILKYTSEKGAPVHHCGRTRVIVHKNAGLKLVKVQMLDVTASHTDTIGGFVEEGARLDVIIAELGAARPLSSCNLVLEGEGGRAGLDVLYLGDGERSLDLSCRIEHRGRKTVSDICAKGILLERSHKVFRDTLDFVSGASGSKGREEENVLMLGPEVRNISVPLLLCGEDDVEGEHAASAGRPDDKILFYLMSRGIDELEAKKLLAQAAFSSIIEKVPDASLREEILCTVRECIGRGGSAT